MEKQKVYDLPTRLFHVLFAGLFLAAFVIAKTTDGESPRFSQHMLLGLILFLATTLRVAWGFVGSRYARFRSFPLKPRLLAEYFRDVLSTKGKPYFAHNPASAWAALAMFALAIGLGTTGILMATGHKEAFEDAHELLANAFAFIALGHVAGVVLHAFRHRDGIALGMVHGKKRNAEGAAPLLHSHRGVALAMAGALGLFAFHVYTNYDAARSTTSVFGLKLELGKSEAGEHHGEHHGGKGEGAEHDDD